MYSKLHCFAHFLVIFALGFAGVAARAQSAAPSQSAAAATVHGNVADPSGARIPGAQIAVTNALGVTVKATTSDATGDFSVTGLAPGNYIVEAQMQGFALYTSPTFTLTAGQSKHMDVSMTIEAAQTQVQVSSEGGPTVSTEAGANTNAIVLKGKDLDALSDDPDELSNELQALAGPSSGPNGGQIYIDGFTGGQLPPKSAILEIRINQNPFSAQFDRLGYGRIEIITKPGSDTFHGRFFGMGNDSSFNTLNPFTTGAIPSYHSYMLNGTVSGPLSKWASFFFSAEQRNNQNDSIYTAQTAVLDPTTNSYVAGTVSGGILSPETHTNISPRIDLMLGQKNTLTMRYQYYRNNESGNIGSTSLPSTANTSNSTEQSAQLDDTQIISNSLVNETRFEYRRANGSSTPVSTEPSVGASSFFSGGGNGGQYSNSHSDHLELQNITTLSARGHSITFGTWLRDNREAISTDAGFNGSFSFPSLDAYLDTINGLANKETFAQIAAACPPASQQPGGCLPNNLSYTSGNENFRGNVFDGALYFQDDWTINPFLTLSGGLRWESQNHTADHDDWAPRFAFAYALDGHKKGTVKKTVVRGGYGLFYDRFDVGSLMSLEMFNGGADSQKQITVANPTCFNSTSLSNIDLSTCGPAKDQTPEIYQISPKYRAPYTEMLGVSLERQLTKVSTLTFTYLHAYGVHQLVTRDSNAYLPGDYIPSSTPGGTPTILAPRPDASLGIVQQFYPEAVFKENQMIVNIHAQFSPNFSLMGFYNYSHADSDGGGGSNPSNSYNLTQDYGRAGFVHPQWLFLMGNYTGPWALTFSPFLIAEAGKPFNISSQNDLTGDSFYNDRPSYAGPSAVPSNVAQTSFGALDVVPQAGETLIPVNMGTGPAAVALNLRLSRSFGIGPKVETPGGPQSSGDHGSGGHSHGGGFGGGFGGPFGGGGGHGSHGGTSNTGHKYSLTFSAQAMNLFNDIDYGTPSGRVTPTAIAGSSQYSAGTRFNKSTSLAGGIFSSGSAARRIYFQASFQF
ncbi:MAG: carboxypeptidase regulatory-like domain-containing protein [Terracidiphilus sp.]